MLARRFCASPEPQSAEAARTAKVELKALQSQHVVGVNYLGRIRRYRDRKAGIRVYRMLTN